MTDRVQEYIKAYEDVFAVSPSFRAKALAKKYRVLDYMAERYLNFLGEDAEEFLRSCSFPLRKAVRCNTLKVKECSIMVEGLREKGFELKEVGWVPYFYWVERSPKSPTLGSTLEYLSGFYYIQSPASGVPVLELDPHNTDRVLDMAAAPGGKTSFISQLMGNGGVVVAVERSRERMRSLLSNLSRLGVANVVTLRQDVKRLTNAFEEYFDKILLDAPCSGEGLIPEDESRRTKTTLSDLKEFFEDQVALVDMAIRMLRPGGLLVYSTCSIAPEENEMVVNYLIEYYDVEIERVSSNYPALTGITEYRGHKLSEDLANCIRFYPHISGTEGFFVCKIRRKT